MDIEAKIQKYINLGYIDRHDFPDEYTLLINRKTMDMIRIYLNGKVWEKKLHNANYVLIES